MAVSSLEAVIKYGALLCSDDSKSWSSTCLLSTGETNAIPWAQWELGPHIPRTVRVIENPMPYKGFFGGSCGAEDGAGNDCYNEGNCGWNKELEHRNAAWAVTAINKMLKSARLKVPAVGTYDEAGNLLGAISLAYWYATYILPLCTAIDAFAENISTKCFRDRFYKRFSSGACGATTGQCGSGGGHYYPVQYWEGVEIAMCAALQDTLNDLKIHIHALKAEAAATITGKEIAQALMGAPHLEDLNLGQYQAWGKTASLLGVDVTWDPTKADESFEGYSEGKEEDTTFVLPPPPPPKETNWTLILLGGAALVGVLLLRPKKKG